jgi:tRNA modification GTPase
MYEAHGVDEEAVRRARAEAELADAVAIVIDGIDPRLPDVIRHAAVWIVSKVDRVNRDRLPAKVMARRPIFTSAVTGEGLDELRERLREFSSGAGGAAVGARFVVSLRQRERLGEAGRSLATAEEALAGGLGMEFVALDLRAALEAVGSVTGRQVSEDLLDRIFERFCVGK